MRKLVLFLLTVVLLPSLMSQTCFPDGIDFYSQQEIDNFQINNPDCTKIGGSVWIDDTIQGNITNLLGLSNITSIGGTLIIKQNDSLFSLEGLENLDSIGIHFFIDENINLLSIAHLENLTYVRSIVSIEENNSLLTLEGLDNLDTIGYLDINGNESLLHLHNLSNLRVVMSEFRIDNNQSLANLNGLESLRYIYEDVKIFNNDLLTDLNGLNNLEHIVAMLKIRYNDQLTSLDGLEKLDTMAGLSINDNPLLSSLESINDSYIRWHVSIHDNPYLSTCNINSICEFLIAHPEDANIIDNDSNCNSVEEIKELCYDYISEDDSEKLLKLYPNPSHGKIEIRGVHFDEVSVYNLHYQKMLPEINENTINISNLTNGIYIIEIKSNGKVYRKKVIKN